MAAVSVERSLCNMRETETFMFFYIYQVSGSCEMESLWSVEIVQPLGNCLLFIAYHVMLREQGAVPLLTCRYFDPSPACFHIREFMQPGRLR